MGVRKNIKSQGIKARRLHNSSQSGGKDTNFQANDANAPDPKTQIWQVIAMIPEGKVASYGQIAALIGLPSHARYVGATLRNLPANTKLPWYRVINANMRISLRGGGEQRQRRLLEAEDITFIGARIAKAHRWEAGIE
jgi:methylated-DNA-protein-cysteine methyltransferase-like protein